jgi:hypothetical protein
MSEHDGLDVKHKWAAGTIVEAVTTMPAHNIVQGNLYAVGHPQGNFTPERRPCYWVTCEDGITRVVLEDAFKRASLQTKRM